MPTTLPLDAHLEGLRAALVAFVRYADRAGLRAGVPTCPEWTVRNLVAHQGMVHRWSAAIVRGERLDPDAVQQEGQVAPDPLEWLRDGAIEIAAALHDAPEDLKVLRFLDDPPPARQFWARRQCHETTIHAVDALAAALGRYPVAADTWIERDLALDGIDELLTGFITRSVSRLRSEDPVSILVRPTDSDRSWLVQVGPGRAVTTRDPGPVEADVLLEGSAVALYLTLWNRSDEVTPTDTPRSAAFDLWRDAATIRWA